MDNDYVEINTAGLKSAYKKTKTFFSNKRVQNILLIILLLSTIFVGAFIRVQNIDHLKDQTTGEYIPLALDPFYFLRISETIVEQGWNLPSIDPMRAYPQKPYISEILPQSVVLLHGIANLFGDYSIQYINIISPIVFFGLGLIVFFFLVFFISKSKSTALISSIFLAFIPPYLYRTMAGFSDHEAIGMLAFFLVLSAYTLAMKFLDREKVVKNGKIKSLLFGAGVGLLSALTVASWGGVANFVFMIIPLSFGLFWLFKTQNPENVRKDQLVSFLIFYSSWIFFSIFSGVLFGFSFPSMVQRVLMSLSSLGTGIVLLFILSDFFVMHYRNKLNFLKSDKAKKYRILYSFLGAIIIGSLILLTRGDLFSTISNLFSRLLSPFGTARVGLTVAENKQPFLDDWIGQIGKIFFWVFVLGMAFVGTRFSKGIHKKQNKFIFSAIWIVMILGVLFSRISSNSLLNGNNFISRALYFGVLFLFVAYSVWLYFNDRIDVKPEILVLAIWLLVSLVAARGAIRLFFVITPFAAFMGGYALINSFKLYKNSKGDLFKMFIGIVFVLVLIGSLFALFGIPGNAQYPGFIKTSLTQAQNTGPSANSQWQEAMKWVRENTAEGSVFLHWWDYGYWIQYLGQRATLADGGHFEGAFRDHLIGRYVLTETLPERALSFMKTNNASYLLIDPTDLGKYGAYSKIGSDSSGEDRFSQIPVMFPDSQQTRETNTTLMEIYGGGAFPVDEDILHLDSEKGQIFLPKNKALIIGTIIQISKISGKIGQPIGVFFYNNQQIQIPLRYAYYNNHLVDFGTGIEATSFIFPSVSLSGSNINVNNKGTILYLSPKVSQSLFAQLYLMDDPLNKYPTITLSHAQDDLLVQSLRTQSANLGDFVYYGGFRGPIKIWNTEDMPSNIVEHEEFLQTKGEYAEFDNLQFTK